MRDLHFLIEVSNALEVEEELAARAVLEYEVELLWVLECVLHFYDKRVGNAFLQRRVSGVERALLTRTKRSVRVWAT